MTAPWISLYAGLPRETKRAGLLAALLRAVERGALLAVAFVVPTAPHSHGFALLVGYGLLMLVARWALRRAKYAALEPVFDKVGGACFHRQHESGSSALRTRLQESTFVLWRALGEHLPEWAGEALASLFAMAALLCVLPRWVWACALAFSGLAFAMAFWAERRGAALLVRSFERMTHALEELGFLYDARVELYAHGGKTEALRAHLLQYAREGRRADAFSSVLGRIPAAVLLVGVSLGWAFGAFPEGASVAAVVGASAAPLIALLRRTHDVARALSEMSFAAGFARVRPAAPEGGGGKDDARVVLHDVCFVYEGGRGLNRVNGEFPLRGVVLVHGPNGCGKSTLLRLLLGYMAPTSGEVTVRGAEPSALAPAHVQAWFSYVPQKPAFSSMHSIRSAVELFCPKASQAAIETELARWGLLEKLSRANSSPLEVTMGSLSQGERQCVALSRAFLRDASALLLDEPEVSLDEERLLVLVDRIAEAAAGKLVVVVAHQERFSLLLKQRCSPIALAIPQ